MDPWQTIEAERLDLADLLDDLTPEQWDTPSLCGAWTVAEVATHLMVGPTGSLWQFVTAMGEARGRFADANQILVRRRMDRPRSAIAADLREFADHRFTPPTMDWHAPLADLLVHRLDLTHPLGLDGGGDPESWSEVLGFLVSRRARRGFVAPGLPGLTLVAPDVGWSSGAGPRVEGPAEALALAVTRRPVRLDELEGPGAETLREWARGG
ncbi:MAG: maleylpyruvate isomerase family mycothiol-dependent enzyme [Nocardioidaceae bacterium]